jgi:hypothetical protein
MLHVKRKISTILLIYCLALPGCASLATLFQDDAKLKPDWDSPEAQWDRRPATEAATSREEWIESYRREQAQIESARRYYDLTVGMSMSDVASIWGEPRDVETAGNPALGNQRWTYYEGLSSRWSMSTARMIYFERGRVVGWETR